MRQVRETVTKDGERRYRVRYRHGKTETSETFIRRADAQTFAAIIGTGGNDSIAEALRWLAARQSEETTATFGAYFDAHVEALTGVTERTRADYQAQRRRYLGELDQLPLTLITRTHVAGIVNKLDRQGLSAKTIENVVRMLSGVLGAAADDGLVTRNPAKRIRLPRPKVDGHEVQFLAYEQAARLVYATPEHYRPLVITLLGTGLRWSEATALEARHVDLDHGTIAVRQAWKRIPGGWEIDVPKSSRSIRTVNPAVDALVAIAPLLRRPRDLVFITPTGRPVRHANFYNRVWVPSCERAELDPRPTIHSSRHTHASWLISDGQSLEAVQDQLGHESIETTRKVYAHLLPAVGVAVGKAASEAMARVLSQRPQGDRFAGALTVAPAGQAD